MDDDLSGSHPGYGVCCGADHHHGRNATTGKWHMAEQYVIVLAVRAYLCLSHRHPWTYYPPKIT